MPLRLNALALILLVAGCSPFSTNQPPERPTHASCSTATPYAGPALRAPLGDGLPHLTPGGRSGLTAREHLDLAAAFTRAREATGASSITVAVWQSGGTPWTASHGTPEGYRHSWASVGKIVTAAAVLRLAEDGWLSLDDPIARYVDHVPNGDIITLRMLMTHTAGLFSANEDPRVRVRDAPLDLDGVVEVIRRQPPHACPGAAWRYSNSGYALLGAVIEAVTGQPYPLAVRDLVLARSAGRGIQLLAPGDGLGGIVLPTGVPDARRLDLRSQQAAGGVVARSDAMALFLRDLMAGRILPRRTVAGMLADLYPMDQEGLWYGLGLMVYDVPDPEGAAVWIGHSGGVPGARALLAHAPALEAIVAVALTGEGSAEATAHALFSALEDDG